MSLSTSSNHAHGNAFTLVEVMISVALVLVLIIGVNKVFKITADTVGAGQTMSANVRDSRAAQTVIYNDLAGAVTQAPPMFMIASGRVTAFRNKADAAGDLDVGVQTGVAREAALRTIDFDGNNTEGEATVLGEIISPAIYNYRSHRIDRLGFFSRDLFARQTANDGAYSNNTTSFEAWIWYGHLKMTNNAGVMFFEPGDEAPANQSNMHASDFALGRVVTLVKDPTSLPAPAVEHRLVRGTAPGGTAYPTANPVELSPLAFGTGSSDTTYTIEDSRFDVAGITMDQFANDLRTFTVVPGTPVTLANPTWWQRMVYAPAGAPPAYPVNPPAPWTLANKPPEFRYEADRFVTKPLTSAQAARLAPVLLNGCTQFIVEFAGDYITQNNDPSSTTDYGDVIAGAPGQLSDGITDFVIDSFTGVPVRSIRWYGMPRDVAGSATGGPDGRILAGTASDPAVDVVPVGIVRGAPLPFERTFPTTSNPDYALAPTAATPAMDPAARYTCMWGPDVYQNPDPILAANSPLPQMLRITFVLDEPNGRLAEGQTYEFIITLPR